ncbi:MAG: DUF3172 domain-containing protein [Aphanocapsa feldmannii 277cV]|uniref:DUF3172 domain-containing protein n=2 Tax=Aphanocapsa feldmannii TaxID=192050 RepID=A0A524RNB0_9CHRO|nr:MAG: DUF3172 domain-containing protein [Aphanocapsa feldmannii 288cV]TGG92278.1 MAG: DUF3172 domain-containing protein [Aphanocapsa feldmannii 277cV]TGH26439.1 MAG: DUF3172 domain-containing protein [Aphanocapsa feldmannii 277cI]
MTRSGGPYNRDRGRGRSGPARSGARRPSGADPYDWERVDRADDRGQGRAAGRSPHPPATSPGGPGFTPNVSTISVLAGVLVIGIGLGSFVTTTQSAGGETGNIASSQDLDLAVPDPEFCKQWGASAYVIDVETYQTMNPVSSFVTQPKLQAGCVIRRENWSVLQKEGVVSSEDMRQCKQRMNTFAYIGSIRDQPVVRCVYQTDTTDNLFLGRNAGDNIRLTREADQF